MWGEIKLNYKLVKHLIAKIKLCNLFQKFECSWTFVGECSNPNKFGPYNIVSKA